MSKRVLTDPRLRDLQEDLRLKDWVGADTERRERYFRAAEAVREVAQSLAESELPEDEVVEGLALALRNDPVLRAHVQKWQGTESPGEDWTDILRAAAGTILECQDE